MVFMKYYQLKEEDYNIIKWWMKKLIILENTYKIHVKWIFQIGANSRWYRIAVNLRIIYIILD